MIDNDSEAGSWKDAIYWKNLMQDKLDRTASHMFQVGGEHYASKSVQPWDAMEAWMSREAFEGYLRGNAIKYLARAGSKGPSTEDYRKAQHYLTRLLELIDE